MTAYNREMFITDAIESVLSSTYKNFELIIVDDASTDNTVQIAKEYEANQIKKPGNIRSAENNRLATRSDERRAKASSDSKLFRAQCEGSFANASGSRKSKCHWRLS